MSSRAHTDAARLRRLKRIAQRNGLSILTTSKPDRLIINGGYMLSNEATHKAILGDQPRPYSANLDQIEAYIEKLTGGNEAEDSFDD
jgi:hypothetical protein